MAEIQLSSQLIQDIQQAVQRHEPSAEAVHVVQYLAAVMGYAVAAQQDIDVANRDQLIDELCAFARHVYDDVQRSQQPQPRPPMGEAFGYWEPPK